MKMDYVEPKEYFTPSMKKILEEGELKSAKKADKKTAQKRQRKTKKKSK